MKTEARMAHIPNELKLRPQWVCWKREMRDGKQTKVPYIADTGECRASSTNPATWRTFEDACGHAARFDGIGFVFGADDPYCGIDLDHAIDADTGEVDPAALEILRDFPSYTELSPSGTGLHIICRAELPGRGTRKRYGAIEVEMYDRGRYFTITGNAWQGCPSAVADCQHAAAELYGKLAPPGRAAQAPRQPGSVNLSDLELLEKARNAANGAEFSALFDDGDSSAFGGDESRADFALCSHLNFWTGNDADRVDRLFRQSALMRDKWERSDYRQRTITNSISASPHTPGKNGRAAPVQGWPDDLDEAALHGLAGDFVRLVAPETEAHPVALLVQILVAFGNLIGRTGHFVAEADKHFANLYAVLVGQSSKARKGSSLGHVLRLAEMIDPDWRKSRIMSGLSSGEGLIFNVRDPQFRNEEIKKDGKRTGETVEVQTDEGVADKRLLVIEPEFAAVLRVLEREGNTLSAFIRQGWDSGDLRVMNKNSPLVATGVHLSIVGHVTADELKRYLNRTEAGNGFANRFLWLCVRRARCLPEGGHVPDSALEALAGRMREAVGFARQYRLLRRTEAAREIWAEVYPELSEGRPGMAGALIARAEAQVMRIAMLYALLDQSDIIDIPHLMAGLALWTYAEQSVGFIFGNALGDPLADDILAAVTSCTEGLTRSQIRDRFHRNLSGSRVESALALLEQGGLVKRERQATDGRPSERIIATSNDTTTKTT